jgi:hypothetical protein
VHPLTMFSFCSSVSLRMFVTDVQVLIYSAVSDVFQDEFQEETDARDHIGIACSMLQFLAMNDCHVLDSCKEVIDDFARTISSRFTSLFHSTSDLKMIVTVGEQLQRRMEQHPDASIDWAPFEDMVEAVREEFDSIAKAPTSVIYPHLMFLANGIFGIDDPRKVLEVSITI